MELLSGPFIFQGARFVFRYAYPTKGLLCRAMACAYVINVFGQMGVAGIAYYVTGNSISIKLSVVLL